MNAKAHARHHPHNRIRLDAQVLCGCANLTYEAYHELLTREPSLSFEEVLRKTGSGGTCTACLLDLEYHYSDIQGKAARRGVSKAATATAPAEGAKQRTYRFVDGISPSMPFRKRTWSLVVVATGMRA